MIPQKEIIDAYLRSQFAEKGLDYHPDLARHLQTYLQLIDRPPNEQEAIRTVSFEEDSSGKITAYSFSLYNIAFISPYDLLGFLGKELGIFAFEDAGMKMIYAFGMLLHEFIPHLTITFDPQDSEVLFAIAQLQKKEFTTVELSSKYTEILSATLSEKQLENSLQVLVDSRVIKRTAKGEYRVREKIKNLVRED